MDSTVIFPCCGLGTRMGSELPKPLFQVNGKTLIEWSVKSLKGIGRNLVFVILKDHDERFGLGDRLLQMFRPCKIVRLDRPTDGAARTVLHACHLVDKNAPLIISNCDQYYEWDAEKFCIDYHQKNADGATLTFQSDHQKWSYVRLDEEGMVTEVAEKRVISNHANVGVYFYSKSKFFIDAAHRMMALDERVNNEWYTAPTLNHMIFYGARILPFEVNKMVGLGTVEDANSAKDLINV